MVAIQPQTWQQVNQESLMAAIAQVRSLLEYHGRSPKDAADPPPPLSTSINAGDNGSAPLALHHLCQALGLSPFECNVLLLCAGMEFIGQWGVLCALAYGNPDWPYPTFSLAQLIFGPVSWAALTPMAPLRRYRLVEIQQGTALMTSQLRLDERILHYLMGVPQADVRLQPLIEAVPPTSLAALVPSHRVVAQQIVQTWQQTSSQAASLRRLPIAQLGGRDRDRDRPLAAAVGDHFDFKLCTLTAQALPTDLHDVALLQTLCEREFCLERTVYLVDMVGYDSLTGAQKAAIAQFIETLDAPLLISSDDRYPQQHRPQIYLAVQAPTKIEQQQLWHAAFADLDVDLVDLEVDLNDHVAALTSHFNLNASVIDAACLHVKVQRDLSRVNTHANGALAAGSDRPNTSFSPVNVLWRYCRSQARPRLDELAQRIETQSSWDNLVLPDKEQTLLKEIAAHVRQRSRVYDTWGFGQQSDRGLGISALFSGASGTGKTLSAEVIANDLHLDLYRIDLSSIVSKYIGETEKNLRRVFDAAEGGGVILLFDEADALFGKRSDVKDSHDRHANMEVSYLLQRMESYQGLAILTTNLKRSMDQAFLRRLRFVIQFPFPDAAQRAEIWQRIFPAQMPRDELKYDKLSKLSISGGNIRNIAVNAAFIAADADEAVGMKHILQAAKGEYSKLERPLTDAEVKGWV